MRKFVDRSRNPFRTAKFIDITVTQILIECGGIRELCDADSLGAIEANSVLHGAVIWPLEVIGVSSASIRAASALLGVVVSLDHRFRTNQAFENVELSASRTPAGAWLVYHAILSSPRDFSIQQPNGRQIIIEFVGSFVLRHGKFKDENLLVAGKTLCVELAIVLYDWIRF